MTTVTYRINGRAAALEADRLYRRLVDGRLMVRIDNGALRDASPEETAAARVQLSDMVTPTAPGEITRRPTPDFGAMNKTEIESWARTHHGVDLDRRRRKETLIEEVMALEGG